MKTAIISLLLLCSFSIQAQFSGAYDPYYWSVAHVPACDNGFVNTATVPGSITLTGAEGGCNQGDPSIIAYEITIPTCGNLSFDWNYQTRDCFGPYWDPFGYLLNGVLVQLTLDGSTTSGDNNQSGFVSIPVVAGDQFSFYILSRNNTCGEAQAAISKFNRPSGGFSLALSYPDMLYFGYSPLSCGTLMVDVQGGVPPYSYDWSHDENTEDAPNLSTVCATSPECFEVWVMVTDATCTELAIWAEIEVINVICEGTNKIELCHKNNDMCVPHHTVEAHLAHGDELGACGEKADCESKTIMVDFPQEIQVNQVQSPILNDSSHDFLFTLLAAETKSALQREDMNVFPNPATGKIYLEFDRILEGSYNVSLVNTLGGIVQSFDAEIIPANPVEIDIMGLSAGVYQVWVTLTKGQVLSKSFVIQQ